MNKVITTDSKGKEVEIPEANFQRAIISYLREYSPDRVKIIAEMQNNTGKPEAVPVAIIMLAKNPSEVMSYTDLLSLEVELE
ncbi:hypothetical protein [uncultured Draconibacterium sp.]|uniref:hypothetical protein n=1 Tax=uncultured Draconibacterium sp. TaxID=1573823 RepID=UPI0025EFC308|nr:hypothetical protein [uncultured Draconibacterium sp.]